MKITKEPKEKLSKAPAREEAKAMPGDKAVQKDLESMEDDILEGVVGGIAIRKPEEMIRPVVPAAPKADK